MNVLAIDIGGTHVKILATGQKEHREFVSGPKLTAAMMAAGVRNLAKDWDYDAVSIGYPGPVCHNRPIAEPYNLGKGWVAFDYRSAFKRPVKVINDAAIQALGSYKTGRMLFLGLGTGLGSAMIVGSLLEPMELGHLPYKKATCEDYVGIRGLEKDGKKRWRKHVEEVVARMVAALEPDDVVIGGGNVKKLKVLPPGCRVGDNANAFRGGFRLWMKAGTRPGSTRAQPRSDKRKGTPPALSRGINCAFEAKGCPQGRGSAAIFTSGCPSKSRRESARKKSVCGNNWHHFPRSIRGRHPEHKVRRGVSPHIRRLVRPLQ
jgi:polyphosphate glucokinase